MLLEEQAACEPNERLRIFAVTHGYRMNGHPVAKRVIADDFPQPRDLVRPHFEGMRSRRDVLVGGGDSREVSDRRADVEEGCWPEPLDQVA